MPYKGGEVIHLFSKNSFVLQVYQRNLQLLVNSTGIGSWDSIVHTRRETIRIHITCRTHIWWCRVHYIVGKGVRRVLNECSLRRRRRRRALAPLRHLSILLLRHINDLVSLWLWAFHRLCIVKIWGRLLLRSQTKRN